MSDKLFSVHTDGSVLKSGKPTICPFKPLVAIPKQQENKRIQGIGAKSDPILIEYLSQPCRVDCAMCTIAQDDGKENPDNKGEWYIQLTCGCAPVGGYIDMPEAKEEKKPGLLTSVQ